MGTQRELRSLPTGCDGDFRRSKSPNFFLHLTLPCNTSPPPHFQTDQSAA